MKSKNEIIGFATHTHLRARAIAIAGGARRRSDDPIRWVVVPADRAGTGKPDETGIELLSDTHTLLGQKIGQSGD